MMVNVNIICTWCILVIEAVTVSNLIVTASLVSEIWLAADRQAAGLIYVNVLKVIKTLKAKQMV